MRLCVDRTLLSHDRDSCELANNLSVALDQTMMLEGVQTTEVERGSEGPPGETYAWGSHIVAKRRHEK